jgi:hypothetical protein
MGFHVYLTLEINSSPDKVGGDSQGTNGRQSCHHHLS